MYISKIKTRFRSDSDAAVLGSLGFATTLWQLSQLTKCRRLHTVLILLIYTAGLFFTGQLLRPSPPLARLGREEVQSGPLARPFFDFGVPSLLFNVHSTVNQKTPGSSEAGSWVVYFQTVRKRRHLILRGSRQRRQTSQNLSTAAFSSERERV